MKSNSIKPENLPEAIVWYYIVGTYVIYLCGANYFLTAFMGSALLFYLAKKWWQQTGATSEEDRLMIAPLAWFWLGAILIVELALIVGHFNYDLGMGAIIKSSSHWYRTWAIFAIFPLAGHLKIRPQIIYRAVCILCLQSIIVTAVGTLVSFVIPPPFFYVSPLQVSGGDVFHYQVDLIPTIMGERLRLFAPWATALGMAGNIYVLFAWQETDNKWRNIGVLGSIVMIIFSWSRLAVVSLVLVPIVIYLLSNIIRPWMQFLASITCFLSGLFFVNIMNFLDFSQNLVDSLREDSRDSSNTREAIYSLTLDRWKNEAFVWGHGIIGEKGPSATDHYPIGSHNTWYGLLYLHGIVGFIPFFIAIVWTFIDLLIKAQSNRQAKLCLSLLIVILLSSFTDNIQTFAYIFWPALLMLGIQWKQDLSSSSREFNMIPQRQY
jgi:hypothetical protein